MTRFQQEINGMLGEFWKKRATEEVAKAVNDANEKATVDENGAISWKSNGNYLMDDFCEKLEYAGYNFSREATAVARGAQVSEQIAQYKAMKHEPTNEEIFEMRAAFGAGTKVVDLLSGREYQL